MASELRFEPFDKARHKREAFDSGVAPLNDYLRKTLGQQARRGVTAGYVLADASGTIAGYFTLSSSLLSVGIIPDSSGFPTRMALPATLLGRLAVDKSFRGRGLGSMLLLHALRIALVNAETIGSAVIEVNAKDEDARSFYGKFGFQSLRDDRLHMYLSMADARAVLPEA